MNESSDIEGRAKKGKLGRWVIIFLAVATISSLLGSFPFWGEHSFIFLLLFVVLFPTTVVASLMRWWPMRQAQGVRDGVNWRRKLNLSAVGIALSSLICLLLGIAWFGTAPGTMLMVAGTLLLPPLVILLLLTYSMRDRERLAETMLEEDEEVLYQAEVHWGVFIPTIVVATLILIFTLAPLGTIGYGIATILYLIVLPGTAAHSLSVFFNTELEVTQYSLIAATGLIVRTTRLFARDDLQAVGVQQGLLGKILGFGKISFICKDGYSFKVPGIVDPEGLRQIIMRR
ncbi:membrane-flanked domain [Halorhodospira halochloris]|uniref:Membrane-flanked domain n=1 Tax=Halorhodospira halochloris TaxID=1052 RepID=A0A110B6T0_HALHR|nr:PH domain-containing protein [Halorhodospira halochloris]MBK1650776.1 hypothetical protein [Halorhodospira halochloris]BAU56728.1 membrane-flanked domain [Halorhodospira halochloris]